MKYISLLSGGLDSVVNLYEACAAGLVIKSLTFDYGQKSAAKEIEAAKYFSQLLQVPNLVIDLKWLTGLTNTALVNKDKELPSLANLDDRREAGASAKAVWVPNRNGVFLNIAASFAESLGATSVVPGFNKEEAATFPDNSQGFIEALNHSFSLSTLSQVTVKCFTTDLDKVGMVKRAVALKIDLAKVWSCYTGEAEKCGKCESCQRVMRALDIVGV